MDDGARDNESVLRSQPNTANIDSFPQVELVEQVWQQVDVIYYPRVTGTTRRKGGGVGE